MALQSYGIVVGFDNSPTNIENITPTGADSSWLLPSPVNAYYYVRGLGNYGENRQLTTGKTRIRRGFQTTKWELMVAKHQAYLYFYSTYFVDSTELGKVTINSTLNAVDESYSNYNATIFMPPPVSLEKRYRNGLWLLGADIEFIIYEAT